MSRTSTTTAHAHGCHSMPTRLLRRRHDATFCKLTNNQNIGKGVHKNESNYCPRLVNWSVLDFKKFYFLFETILHPLLLSLPGSAVIFLNKTPASLAGGRCRRNALSTWSWHPCWPGLPARAGASKQSASQPGNAVQPGGACGKSRRTSQPSPRTSVLRAPPSPRHSLGG